MKKKSGAVVFFLSLFIGLSLCGCNEKAASDTEKNTVETQEKQNKKIETAVAFMNLEELDEAIAGFDHNSVLAVHAEVTI